MSYTVVQGDSFALAVEVTAAAGEDPVTLVGATIRAAVYARPSTPLYTLEVGSGITVVTETETEGVPAAYLVRLTPAQTAALDGVVRLESKVRFADDRVEQTLDARLTVTASALGAMT